MDKFSRMLELAAAYGTHNAIANAAKKEATELKSFMVELNQEELNDGEYKITCTESTKENLNTEKMIDIFKEVYADNFEDCPFIKMVPVIDMEALEMAIYNEQISKELLIIINDKCKETTVTHTLRCSKIKKEK